MKYATTSVDDFGQHGGSLLLAAGLRRALGEIGSKS